MSREATESKAGLIGWDIEVRKMMQLSLMDAELNETRDALLNLNSVE